jgi:phosphate transport system substrate-binding protein
MSSSDQRATQMEPAIPTPRQKRKSFGRLVMLAAAIAFCWGSVASAEESLTPSEGNRPANVLRISVSDSGRTIFDGLIPDITAASGLSTPPRIKYTTALGALQEFCHGVGGSSPDIVLTTRRLRPSLVEECGENGVENIAQVALGRSAMILAVRRGSKLSKLTAQQVYLALARDVSEKDEFRRNVAIRWSDIDRTLPQVDIRFQVPPRESSGRPMFNAMVLQSGCREDPLIKLIFFADQRIARCVTTRGDRVREIPVNQAVRALVDAPMDTVGVVSYQDVAQSNGELVAIAVDGIFPDRDAIVEGTYEFSYLYYLYAKRGQALKGGTSPVDPAIDAAVDRIIARALSEPVIGPDGILANLGLIPIPAEDRDHQRALFIPRARIYGAASIANWAASAAKKAGSVLSFGRGLWSSEAGEMDFNKLMDLAGYKIKDLQTTISIIPSAGMTYAAIREMTEADQDHLDRKLAQDARTRVGPLAAIQRSIVRTILDVSETAGYEIGKVEIEFVPLPSVKLEMEPKDPPISADTSIIMRSLERLNERVIELSR